MWTPLSISLSVENDLGGQKLQVGVQVGGHSFFNNPLDNPITVTTVYIGKIITSSIAKQEL